MRKILIIMGMLLAVIPALAQNQIQLSQYHQSAQVFHPALTGVDPFLDVKAGIRQQWSGFDNSPQTFYLGAFGSIRQKDVYDLYKYSLRISSPNYAKTLQREEFRRQGVRHGVGGYVIGDSQGALDQLKVKGNYAFQYPLGFNKYLSLGVTAGINNFSIQTDEISLRDPVNDPVYQSLLNGSSGLTFLEAGLGAAFYTDKYYISYSAGRLINSVISGNEDLQEDSKSIVHYVMAGYRFELSDKFALMPSGFLKSEANTPLSWDANLKLRYLERFWIGAGYRNDESIIGMFGLSVNNMINFSYSYDSSTSDINTFNSGSHEVILGLMLFNNQSRTLPYLW